MTGFQIRSEHFPARCEICHQADLFDPETGECVRCAGISISVSADGSVPAKVGRGVLHRFRLLRLKTFSLLMVLVGSISMYLFVESIFLKPQRGTGNPPRFKSPVVDNDIGPTISIREDEVELSGMLTEAEKKSGGRVGWIMGRITENGVIGSTGDRSGWRFRILVGKVEMTCFCPGFDPLKGQSSIPRQCRNIEIADLLKQGNYVYLAGRYDMALDVLFVSRIIIRETPFRGDKLPQS